MRVGVTGSSGLIGRSLVGALRERGDTIIPFVRPTTTTLVGDVVRWDPERGDVDDGDLKRVGGFDAVVHLAGAGIGDRRWSPKRKSEILTSRVESTSLLVAALSNLPAGAKMLASASAIGWYGSRGDERLDEESPRGAGFLSDVCVAWEAATSPLEDRGLDVAHLRSGVVLTSRGGALKKQLPLFRSGLGGRFGAGSQWMSVISLYDEVRALLWTIDHRLTGPVNLVAPESITNREFTHVLARILRRSALLTVPKWTLKGVLGAEMADELILTSQRVTPKGLQSSNFKFEHEGAYEALKWMLDSTG